MVVWRLQAKRHPLKNAEGARITGGRWNEPGTPVIYASDTIELAALEVMVHHGGIPEDYAAIRIEIPDDIEIAKPDIPDGWPDLVPEAVTASLGTAWVDECAHCVLQVPSVTMSVSGFNYVLNPEHPGFARIEFRWESVRFDSRLRRKRRRIRK